MILPHLSPETKSQLQDVGFLGAYALLPGEYPCDHSGATKQDGDDSPDLTEGCSATCRQPWELCFKTQVAVRAVLLTANEWEYFVTNGEDLSGDKSTAVNEWLRPHLQALKSEATEKIVALEKLSTALLEEHAVAVSMLKERWGQIEVHVELFLDSIRS